MSPDNRGPLASIILAAGNNPDGLPAAAESILRQTYRDFELIIVDNGPGDPVPGLRDAMTDPRVSRIRVPEGYGPARAANTGISRARGELVGFISSGDAWDERKLEEQAACFSRLSPDYGVVYSDTWEITPAGNRAYRHAPDMTGPELLDPYATGFVAAALGPGPLLVRRSCLELAGPFDEQLRYFSDTDMIIRLQRVCRFFHMGKPLYHSRSLQDRESDPFERSIAQILLLQKYPEALENPVFLNHQAETIGRNLRKAVKTCPASTGRDVQEPEHGHFREPVPYL